MPQNPSLPPNPPPATLDVGKKQEYTSDAGCPLDLTALATHLRYSQQCPTMWPVVASLSYEVPLHLRPRPRLRLDRGGAGEPSGSLTPSKQATTSNKQQETR